MRTRALALLAACTGAPAPVPPPDARPAPAPGTATVYTCADGFRFSARLRGDSVVLSLPERTATLARVEPASGTRYSAEGDVFWTKGSSATLETGGTSRADCAGRPVGDPWEEATRLGVDFRAVGQEPGWIVELDKGRWLRYVGDYGSTRLFAPAPAPLPDAAGGALTYRIEGDSRELVVEIARHPARTR